jgi:hypothetical protein
MSSLFNAHEILDTIRHTSAKSSALSNLNWLLGTLIVSFAASVHWAPTWASVFLAVAIAITLVFYLWTHRRFEDKDPDLLRSERYAHIKTAIERGLIGDNVRGLIALPPIEFNRSSESSQNPEDRPVDEGADNG